MSFAVTPIDGTVSLLAGSLGFGNPVLTVAVGVFAALTLLILLVAVRSVVGSGDEEASSDSSDSEEMPDESEWTVSYNPPSNKSKSRSSGRSSRSGGSSSSSSSKRSSGASASSGSASSSGSSSSSSSSPASSSASSSGGASGGSSGSSSASASSSSSGSSGASADGGSSGAATADGSGDTRLYDPATGEPAGTDTQIFTGEKRSGDTCPDCEEAMPSGTDWEFCPFCGFEL